MNMLEWLQEWYASQCDGEWEHDYGITIENSDNPGWSLSIDLKETKLENVNMAYTLEERSDDDWVGFSIENGVFSSVGGARNLAEMIEIFKREYEPNS